MGLKYVSKDPENQLEEGTYFEYRIERRERFGTKTYEFRHDHELDSITFFKGGKVVIHAQRGYNPENDRLGLQLSNGAEEDSNTLIRYRPNELQYLKLDGTWYVGESGGEPEAEPGVLSNVYEAIRGRLPSVFGASETKNAEAVLETIGNKGVIDIGEKQGDEKPAVEEDPNFQPPYCYQPISNVGFKRIFHCTYRGDWQGHGWQVETDKPLESLADEASVICTESGKEVEYTVPIISKLAERLGK